MVALRSFDDDAAPGMSIRDCSGKGTFLLQLWLVEQRDRVRRRLCLRCGVARDLCSCGEYDDAYDRRDYAGPGEGADA